PTLFRSQRKMTRICNNMYQKQRRIKEKLTPDLKQQIDDNRLYENRFIFVKTPKGFNSNMSGYIAGALVNEYQKPVIVLFEGKEGKLYGSLRGHDDTLMKTKTFLQSLDIFEFASGHEQACGVGITKENYDKLNETINRGL